MIRWLALGCFLLALSRVQAAEVLAWKVPLSALIEDNVDSEKMVRLSEAPEPSVFFDSGDEIWNLKRPDNQNALNWLVWNATSKRVVAKGDWWKLYQLHERLNAQRMTHQCELKFEMRRVSEDGSPPSESPKPGFSVSTLSTSGQPFEVRRKSGDLISVIASTVWENGSPLIDLAIDGRFEMEKVGGFSLKSKLTLVSGQPLWVARDFDGKSGLDLKATASLVLPDGTPYDQFLLRQQSGEAKPVSLLTTNRSTKVRAGNGWLVTEHLLVKELVHLGTQKVAGDVLPQTSETIAPPALGLSLEHPVLAIQGLLEQNTGFNFSPNDFIGYDPIRQLLFFYSEKEEKLDSLRSMMNSMDDPPINVVLSTSEGQSQTRVISGFTGTCALSRLGADSKAVRTLEFEPKMNGSGGVELGIFEKLGDGEGTQTFNNRISFPAGESSKVLTTTDREGSEVSLKVQVDVSTLKP